MKENKNIRCDVVSCMHNSGGDYCALNSIKVCCDGDSDNCTCCGDFECK